MLYTDRLTWESPVMELNIKISNELLSTNALLTCRNFSHLGGLKPIIHTFNALNLWATNWCMANIFSIYEGRGINLIHDHFTTRENVLDCFVFLSRNYDGFNSHYIALRRFCYVVVVVGVVVVAGSSWLCRWICIIAITVDIVCWSPSDTPTISDSWM